MNQTRLGYAAVSYAVALRVTHINGKSCQGSAELRTAAAVIIITGGALSSKVDTIDGHGSGATA
jgi:hypothetical protein